MPKISSIGEVALDRVHALWDGTPSLYGVRDGQGQRWLALQEDRDPVATYWLWVPVSDPQWRALLAGEMLLSTVIMGAVQVSQAIRVVMDMHGQVEDEMICLPDSVAEEILPDAPLPNPEGLDPKTGRPMARAQRAGLAVLLNQAKSLGQPTRP